MKTMWYRKSEYVNLELRLFGQSTILCNVEKYQIKQYACTLKKAYLSVDSNHITGHCPLLEAMASLGVTCFSAMHISDTRIASGGLNPAKLAHETPHLRGCVSRLFCSSGPLHLEKKLSARGAHPCVLKWATRPSTHHTTPFSSYISSYMRTRSSQHEDRVTQAQAEGQRQRERGGDKGVKDVEKNTETCSFKSVCRLLWEDEIFSWKTNYERRQSTTVFAFVCLCMFVKLRLHGCSDCKFAWASSKVVGAIMT